MPLLVTADGCATKQHTEVYREREETGIVSLQLKTEVTSDVVQSVQN